MDSKTKNELMEIRSMASLVIEKIDELVPTTEKKRKRRSSSDRRKAEVLARRRRIRLRQF